MGHPVWNAVRRRTGMAAAVRRFARDTAGNPAVEFGLLLPALLTFVFGIAEGGRLLWTGSEYVTWSSQQIFRSKDGITWTGTPTKTRNAQQMITAVLADEEIATNLDLPFGSAVVLVKRTYWLDDGRPAYVAFFYYPGGHYWYEVAITRSQSKGTQLWTTPAAAYEREPL